MVREMTSMMPAEGGYYHWIKQAFGPFAGFMAGWMNWVVSWVDVSIYPVLAAYYLGYFIPVLRSGTVINGMEIPGWVLSWLVGIILIWAISYLNIRGARLAGLTTSWMGVVMLLPLIFMSIVGVYAWIRSGATIALPFIPEGESITGALSVGLFIVMWNYMGWELPTAAGDEIVNPKKTYPLAMVLVLFAAITTYVLPTVAGLYGGAGEEGRYQVWGIEENEPGEGIGVALGDYGITEDQLTSWNVDPSSEIGWEFPDVAHAIGDKVAGKNSPLSRFLGLTVTFSAVLSMIGLFIGNGLGGTRIPFALAEDGMMPKALVKVHPKYGTPWIAIILCAVIFSIFSLNAFAALVVMDVFLNMVALLIEFFALWKMRISHPEIPRWRTPGGWPVLLIVTILPSLLIILAIYSNISESGLTALWLPIVFMAAGAVLYFPLKKWVKQRNNIPDIDPFVLDEAEPGVANGPAAGPGSAG